MTYDVCWPIQAAFVGGEPLCDLGIPSWALITIFRVIWWKLRRWLQMKYLSGPLPDRNVTLWGDSGCFLANSGHYCGRGATLWCRSPLLSPNNFTYVGSYIKKRVVSGCQCNSCQVPCQGGTWHFGNDVELFCQFRPLLWLGSHCLM